MLWIIFICAILPTILSSSYRTALKQETILTPFEDRVQESVGFGRYYVRQSQPEGRSLPENDDETPMKTSLDSYEANHVGRHRRPDKWFYKLREWQKKPQKWQEKPQKWQEKPEKWQEKHLKWQEKPLERSHKEVLNWHKLPLDQNTHSNRQSKLANWQQQTLFTESEKYPRNKPQNEDKKPDNIQHCVDCDPKGVGENHPEDGQSVTNNFIFHKVNVETSYDPFTKRPYHRTILAMRALPEIVRKQPVEQKLPHDYYPVFNVSANDNTIQSRQPITPDGSFTFLKEQNKNAKTRYKYPPQDASVAVSSDYDSEEVEFRRTSMESLWISSYLENPSKFDSISKQLRFLKRWLARLDRNHRRKVTTNK